MGPAVLNTPCARRGVHDSISDGANRIDAREPLSCAAAAGRLPQQTHRADISGANLAQTLALFLQKSFAISGGQELGIDALSRKRRGGRFWLLRGVIRVCEEWPTLLRRAEA